jgi:Flp pilus assembly protein TadB
MSQEEWVRLLCGALCAGVGALLASFGLLLHFSIERRRLPVWARRVRRAWPLALLVSGGAGVAVALVTGSFVFSWVGLLFVPWSFSLVRQIGCPLEAQALERSSLPFFHALTGFLRAGVAVPSAVLRALDAAPGSFSDWVRERLSAREQGETLTQALVRLRSSLPEGEAAFSLHILARLYEQGLALIGLLERQVRWMTREQGRQQKLTSVQASLLAQAAVVAVLPWAILWLGQLGSEESFSWEALWKQREWRWGVCVAMGLQGCGAYALWRLGRFFEPLKNGDSVEPGVLRF